MLSQATIYLLFGGVTLFLALASAFLFWKLTQTGNKIKELINNILESLLINHLSNPSVVLKGLI